MLHHAHHRVVCGYNYTLPHKHFHTIAAQASSGALPNAAQSLPKAVLKLPKAPSHSRKAGKVSRSWLKHAWQL